MSQSFIAYLTGVPFARIVGVPNRPFCDIPACPLIMGKDEPKTKQLPEQDIFNLLPWDCNYAAVTRSGDVRGYSNKPELTEELGYWLVVTEDTYSVLLGKASDFGYDASLWRESLIERKWSYVERQNQWVEQNDIKPGDKVKVLRKAERHEDGWKNSWVFRMDGIVGKIMKVEQGAGHSGILLYDAGLMAACPFFVLEKVTEEPTPVPDKCLGCVFRFCCYDGEPDKGKRMKAACNFFKDGDTVMVESMKDGAEKLYTFRSVTIEGAYVIARCQCQDSIGAMRGFDVGLLQKVTGYKDELVPLDLSKQGDKNKLYHQYLRQKGTTTDLMITGIRPSVDSICLDGGLPEGMDYILKNYTFLNGDPVGKKVKTPILAPKPVELAEISLKGA